MAILDFQNNFIFILLCLFSTLVLFALFIKKQKNGYELPPSPPSLPIIGHLHLLRYASMHKTFQKISSKYGPFLHLRIFNFPIILASTASVVYEIFKDHDIHVSSHGDFGVDECLVFGSTSFFKAPYGDYWKFMKKIMVSKLLGPQSLERSRGVRAVELERFYKNLLDKATKKQIIDIGEEALSLVNATLGMMSMGSRFLEEKDAVEKVSEFSVEFAALTLKIFITQLWRKPLKKLGLLPFKKEIMNASNRYEELFERMFVKHEEKVDEPKGNEVMMDTLLAAYRDENAEYKITRKHVKALMAELFFGAGDTTSEVAQWAMAEIINNPNILKRLREEIDCVVGKTRLVHETDLPKLPYLQAIIKETLRLHPPGVLVQRKFQQGCKIRGFYIPKGTTLIINAYNVMRDPDFWKDPNEFQPERFLGQEKERTEKALKFLPFGAGRRACPGSNVASSLVETSIGVIVQCFDWKIEGEKVNMEEAIGRAFLAKAHPLKCTLIPRIPNLLPSRAST